MPEVKHLHKTLVFTDLVIEQNRAMQRLANARPFSDGAAHAWETSQELHMDGGAQITYQDESGRAFRPQRFLCSSTS